MAIEGETMPSSTEEKKAKEENNISEEDAEREDVNSLMIMLESENDELQKKGLILLKEYCQRTSENMSALPKHLKYLIDKIDALKKIYHNWSDKYPGKRDLSNIISCLSIMDTEDRDCLTFRLSGRQDNIGDWGIEYIRHLAEELRLDFEMRVSKHTATSSLVVSDIVDLTYSIAKFYMKNNCEIDAVDLCGDLDLYDKLVTLIDKHHVVKICRYLIQSSNFLLREDSVEIVRLVINLYKKFNFIPEVITTCARIIDIQSIHDNMLSCVEKPPPSYTEQQAVVLQRQLALMLAHYGIYNDVPLEENYIHEEVYQAARKYACNSFLSRVHGDLARELDVVKPHSPDDIYRITGHKLTAYYTAGYVSDPPRLNLGSAFVSGFVNAAFAMDALLLNDDTYKWMLSQKDSGLMNSIACSGLIYMWNLEDGLLHVDKFITNQNRYIKAGGLLSIGIIYSNGQDEFDTPFALLSDYLTHGDFLYRHVSNMALGLAYAGTGNMTIIDELAKTLRSPTVDAHSKAMAALSMGLIGCGSCNVTEISFIIMSALFSIEKSLTLLDPYIRLIPLGVGLLYIGSPEKIPAATKEMSKLSGEFGRWCHLILKICSNAGTGNVLAVQKLITFINEVYKSTSDTKQKNTDAPSSDAKSTTDTVSTKSTEDLLVDSAETANLEDQKITDIKKKLDDVESYDDDDTTAETLDTHSAQTEQNVNITSPKETNASAKDVNAATDSIKPAPIISEKTKYKTGEKHKSSSSSKREFKKEKDNHNELDLIQGLATLGVALISMSEDVSQKMAIRLLSMFLQFGNAGVRRAVPISFGILFASNPQVQVIELLSKLSHDVDSVVSSNAIIGLGIVSAGTNHSRVANMLRNLGIFYYRDPVHLFAVRLAQGLVHLSKGLMTMSPFRSDQTLLSPLSIACFLIHGVLSLDVKNSYLTMDPHLFFWLVPTMKLRALITYDEDMNLTPVSVRVGQAIDDTGQAGNPKRITAFQTQRTPILLNAGERAELATDEYIAYTNVLENIVLVRKAPEIPK